MKRGQPPSWVHTLTLASFRCTIPLSRLLSRLTEEHTDFGYQSDQVSSRFYRIFSSGACFYKWYEFFQRPVLNDFDAMRKLEFFFAVEIFYSEVVMNFVVCIIEQNDRKNRKFFHIKKVFFLSLSLPKVQI